MPVPKLVITMALPLMLSLLVQSLYNIVDGIFVGRISEEAFAATSLAYPVQLLMVAVSVGTGVGVNAVVSRMVGAKRYEDANRTATTGLILSVISCLIFMIFGGFFLKYYIELCGGSESSLVMCQQYLRICTLFSLGIFLETLGLNAATNHEVRLTFKDFRMSRATIWPIYKVGLPTILTQAMGAIMLFSMNAILGALLPGLTAAGTAASAPAIAFFGAYNKLQNFLYMPMHGLGNGMVNMVGTCLRQFIPLVPLAFLFGKLGGVGSIWYAMWISEALAVLFAAFSARKIIGKKLSILNVTEG